MNVPITNPRYVAGNAFEKARFHAHLASLKNRAVGRMEILSSFISLLPRLHSRARFLGVQSIPADRIMGSAGKLTEYDARFRPLSRDLRAPWIEAALQIEQGRLAPVQLYKVGPDYYVVDKFHAVSAALSLGVAYLDAEVWEFEFEQPRPARLRALQPMPAGVCCEVRAPACR